MSPIYSYECPRGHRFDKRVPMAEMNELQPCEGRMVLPPVIIDVGPDPAEADEMPEVIQCKVPAKRLEVPSSPAHFIIH